MLQEVNDLLYDDNDAMMFVTVLYAVYNPATRELTYANGGHNLPVIVHSDGSNTVMPSTNGIALGILDGGEYEQNSITCAPGDTVVLYTDGVTEAINMGEEEFGMERLQEIFTSAPDDCRKAVEGVFEAVSDFAGEAPQFDDITCLALRVK